jgi:riboflavin synthase
MFTGLIEAVGRVATFDERDGGRRLGIESPLAADLGLGDSIAVNGVCLTVVSRDASSFLADVSPATLRVTTLGAWKPGRRVNLERPVRADQRMGGHFVLGHVDAVTQVTAIRAEADCYWMECDLPPDLQASLIPRGSISLDGISLTVASLEAQSFAVQIVPHTWAHTALPELAPGMAVNVEGDVLGKYVARVMSLQSVSGSVPAWRNE